MRYDADYFTTETFIDKLEQQFSFFIAERHPDTVVVHSAQEYYDAVKELTGGNSLESNIALVLNNAVVGAGIAKEFVKLQLSLALGICKTFLR